MASLIRYLCRHLSKISSVVRSFLEFSLNIGVPVKPNICVLVKKLTIFLWLSPKWLRWHSSKIMMMRDFLTSSKRLLYHCFVTAALSFWMVVIMIFESLESFFVSSSVLSVLSTAPGSNASYSDCVCVSRSWRSTTNITLSTPSNSETSCAALKEVRVLPAPVVCQMKPLSVEFCTLSKISSTA